MGFRRTLTSKRVFILTPRLEKSEGLRVVPMETFENMGAKTLRARFLWAVAALFANVVINYYEWGTWCSS